MSKRPVLVFIYEHERGWVLKNVGNAPALNIVAAQKRVMGDKTWFDVVRIAPLSRDQDFVLTYLEHVNDTGLGATYTDIENRNYSSVCGVDLSTLSKGLVFEAPAREIVQVWKRQRTGSAQ